jgi:hypothetical protein
MMESRSKHGQLYPVVRNAVDFCCDALHFDTASSLSGYLNIQKPNTTQPRVPRLLTSEDGSTSGFPSRLRQFRYFKNST